MTRYFTHYWTNASWNLNRRLGYEGDLLEHTAGNLFRKRGVRLGDVIYVVSAIDGMLYLLGKMVVKRICNIKEAAGYFKQSPKELWQAKEHIISDFATPMHFDFSVPQKITMKLLFVSDEKTIPLRFSSPGHLDQQTLRGLRELTAESAAKLDRLLPRLEQRRRKKKIGRENNIPEEISGDEVYYEGSAKSIKVNVYERNAKARKECVAHHGVNCSVCGINFQEIYGDPGKDFIHTHHLIPLSEIDKEYVLDPIKDLLPICPNCHAIAHRKRPPYLIDELKKLIRKR